MLLTTRSLVRQVPTLARLMSFSATPPPPSASDSSSSRPTTQIPPLSMEDSIRTKLEDLLQPTLMEVRNDSSKHSHHAPMKVPGAYTGETHFAIYARSDVFLNKTRIARHRLVNDALKDEFDRGLHALSLKLETELEGKDK